MEVGYLSDMEVAFLLSLPKELEKKNAWSMIYDWFRFLHNGKNIERYGDRIAQLTEYYDSHMKERG